MKTAKRTVLNARKRDLITVKVSGNDTLVMVLEAGEKTITGYNMGTGRVVRIHRYGKPSVKPVIETPSPIAVETSAIMTDIMETKVS